MLKKDLFYGMCQTDFDYEAGEADDYGYLSSWEREGSRGWRRFYTKAELKWHRKMFRSKREQSMYEDSKLHFKNAHFSL